MSEMISSLLVAQTLGEYGALAGFASAVDRFARLADDVVRNPRSSVPIAIAILVLGYFLLRRRS
jgi:hypothetical protein